ncbi:RIKEN cDNA 6330500D04, isoform CRA_b [Mus musculus]|nr:RIKEN cDNA 6330500D04, isoform CRA_b [Mus musculus]
MQKLAAVSDENLGNITSVVEAIPEFHKKLSLLAFWTKCCSPSGVYHSSAARLIKQLEASFARSINKDYPGLAEPGTDRCERLSSRSPGGMRPASKENYTLSRGKMG